MGAQIGRTGSFSVQQEITKRFFLVGQGHRVVGKEGCRMGKKRTGTKRSGPVSWVGKNVLLGGLIGAGLCALAAALVMGGVIPQEGLMTAGRCAALLGAVASGLICACMAKERKVQWAAVASGCTAVCALMGNLLFVGPVSYTHLPRPTLQSFFRVQASGVSGCFPISEQNTR